MNPGVPVLEDSGRQAVGFAGGGLNERSDEFALAHIAQVSHLLHQNVDELVESDDDRGRHQRLQRRVLKVSHVCG